jgi:hypothetical protein
MVAAAWPSLGERPVPLSLTTEEMDLLLALAAPIDQRQRDQFLHEVAAELEAASAQTGVGPGLGGVHRVARTVQRRFFDPPQLPNAGKMARA